MKWDDLKIVLAVSRSGTMSGAAKLLNVQHSTVSRRIKALERQLGTNLVRRNKGSYELTRAGQKVTDTAIRVEKEITSVDGTLLKDDDPLKGVLRVTTINSLASTRISTRSNTPSITLEYWRSLLHAGQPMMRHFSTSPCPNRCHRPSRTGRILHPSGTRHKLHLSLTI